MSNQQLDQALAELTNYEGLENYDTPCYSYEPIASIEIQAKAIAYDAETYVRNLGRVVCDWSPEKFNCKSVAELLMANPRQRAEAVYMTLIETQSS